MSLIKHIIKLNQIYDSMRKNYSLFRKMFRNHSSIIHKINLSEQFLMDAFKLTTQKMQETEDKRKFNSIVKVLKHGKK